MKFLADENTHGFIVKWLREHGYDVLWVTESLRGKSDFVLIDKAAQEQRLILTADLDFGELVFKQRLNSHGVILLRLEHLSAQERIIRLQAAWSVVEANPIGKFIVIAEDKVRVRNLQGP